jgi:hypothetical protein
MPNAVNFLIYPLKLGVITAQTPSRLPKPHFACPNLISPAQTSFRLPKTFRENPVFHDKSTLVPRAKPQTKVSSS